MSTRATIHFHNKGSDEPEAIIYRHNDGYPEGLGVDLRRFIAEVRANVKDSRFTDPSYLAAKWIVFDAAEHRECASKWNNGNPVHDLDFLSIGVCAEDPGDIEYRYHVICDGQPTLWGEEMECQSDGAPKAGRHIEIPEPEKFSPGDRVGYTASYLKAIRAPKEIADMVGTFQGERLISKRQFSQVLWDGGNETKLVLPQNLCKIGSTQHINNDLPINP